MPSLKNFKCPVSAILNPNPFSSNIDVSRLGCRDLLPLLIKVSGKKVLDRINSPPKQPKCKNKKKKMFISPALVGMKLAPERLGFQKHFHFH